MISSFRIVRYVFRGRTDSKWQNRDVQQPAKESEEHTVLLKAGKIKLGMRNAMEFRKGSGSEFGQESNAIRGVRTEFSTLLKITNLSPL